MNILVIGATGYIGGAVSAALRARGHVVTGAARSADAAATLSARGDKSVIADVRDPAAVASAARDVDGVVYAVQYRGRQGDDAGAVERAALEALVGALERSERPLVFTSGAWYYGPTGGRIVDETAPANPPAIVATRPGLERAVLDGASRGVRGVVIRPGDVYGNGTGLASLWIDSIRRNGVVRYIGTGDNHWPVVHVADLAELFAIALERAEAGDVFNGAAPEAYTVREMADAVSRGNAVERPPTTWPVDDARKTFGPLADALAMDQRISSERARKKLGWRTTRPTILQDLEHGSYAHLVERVAQQQRAGV